MTLALIAELLPYPSRSITVAYEYDYRQEWMEKLWRIIVRSGPSGVSAHERNTNIPADFDLVWSLQFHKTGIGFAGLRVVNRPGLPASITLLRQARYEDKPDDRSAAIFWIRVVNIGLFFSLTRLRLAPSVELYHRADRCLPYDHHSTNPYAVNKRTFCQFRPDSPPPQS